MSDLTGRTYVARIIITLPGQNKETSMVITLAPQDAIPANGRAKPLADCTLADLRAYADTLEQEVWEAYEQITLLDLDASPDVEVEVTVVASSANNAVVADGEVTAGESTLEDWEGQLLVLPANAAEEQDEKSEQGAPFKPEMLSPAGEAEAASPDEQTVGSEQLLPATETDSAVITEIKPVQSAESASSAPPVPAEELTSEKQTAGPVSKPEQEDGLAIAVTVGAPIEEEEEPLTPSRPAGVITPSKARVRVAGQQLPMGDSTWAAADILMDEPALRAMQAHALASLDREVAGVMIGPRPEKQPDGRYLVHVIDAIAAKYTVMHGASVTYTPESWRYLNDALRERYPDETAVMVGWYHTHPGFGIFLSGMDLFIHQNFFTQIWHVAYVLDPRARTSGFFGWDRRRIKVNRHDFAWPDWAAGSW
jgi:proteasome lid subunit RPN8/RPN11